MKLIIEKIYAEGNEDGEEGVVWNIGISQKYIAQIKALYKLLGEEEIDKILYLLGFVKNRIELAKVNDFRFSNLLPIQEGIMLLDKIEAIINAREGIK